MKQVNTFTLLTDDESKKLDKLTKERYTEKRNA